MQRINVSFGGHSFSATLNNRAWITALFLLEAREGKKGSTGKELGWQAESMTSLRI